MIARIHPICLWPYSITFRNIRITSPYDNLSSEVHFNKIDYDDALELVDFFAFILYSPTFLETKNKDLNDELLELLEPIHHRYYIKLPNFRKVNETITVNNTLNFPIMLSLYNSSLKQSDPLAKCVFLFRVIEFAYENIERFSVKPKLEDYTKDICFKAMKHKFIPIVYEKTAKVTQSKIVTKDLNLIIQWKRKAKEIINEWTNKRINVGQRIYGFGRSGIAHGMGLRNKIIFHDYAEDYKEINKINILLELMSRYLIERENKQFRSIILKGRDLYSLW